MLIKIGDAWIDPQEIAMINDSYDSHLEVQPQICIHLRHGSGTWIHSTMDEAEAALIDAGLIEEPTCDEPPELTEAELTKLSQLYDNGYKYLARDGDGKLFAYMAKPNSDGIGFYPSSFTEKAAQVFEAFNFLVPGAWLEIAEALNGWTL